jgi:hypothetical protein
MGAVGGGIWYGIKGARNSPRVRLVYNGTSSCPNGSCRESALLVRYPP